MLKKIWRWLTGATAKIKKSLTFGHDVANSIKTIADSSLLDIIVALTPTELDDIALASFRVFMDDMVKRLNWADKILTDADEYEKTVILHTLSATAAFWKAGYEKTDLNLQTTLSTAQLVYNVNNINLNV